MTKWFYPALAATFCAILLLMLNDLRLQAKRSAQTLNDQLPAILDRTKKSADTLAVLSEDIRQLRDLAGVGQGARDMTLAAFADRVLDAIESTDAVIGLKPKLVGEALKETVPAKQWVADARKEALWLTFRSSSREEMLAHLCRNKYGSDWYIQPMGLEPVRLGEWVEKSVPDAGTK
jgi:hypothetical protein